MATPPEPTTLEIIGRVTTRYAAEEEALEFLKHKAPIFEFVHGMSAEARKTGLSFGMRDAREAMELWFDGGSESNNPKQVAARTYLLSNTGKRTFKSIVDGLAVALKNGGGRVGFRDIGNLLIQYMAGTAGKHWAASV
jgi:hypothetical protein